eukprot:COSAG01_NODE_28170_length_667_cov_1.816901_2_plen_79_part_00
MAGVSDEVRVAERVAKCCVLWAGRGLRIHHLESTARRLPVAESRERFTDAVRAQLCPCAALPAAAALHRPVMVLPWRG